ncbi:hypothetical protein [Rhizobium johnstonii]|uniref:hypothetical protein n=1 Tax=Rhizobium johnstonii TaxID=3019933 RepID=UPI003F9C86BC
MRLSAIMFTILALSTTQAHSGCLEGAFGRGCFRTIDEALPGMIADAQDAGKLIKPMDVIKVAFPTADAMIQSVGSSGIPYLNSAAQNVAVIGTKLDKETQTAISNTLTNPVKGVRDAAQTALKAANDTIDAAEASGRYAERMVSGTGDILDKAQVRLREGKVVDAVWHLSVDRARLENNNSAQLMQESETARQLAQSAAATAGGPAGAAAFAAWYTYNVTKGDVQKAILAGVYTYAVGSKLTEVNNLPTGTIDAVAKKAATVAAVRGLAVAASGGSDKEVLDAMAEGGGSVIVQSSEAYITKKYVNPIKAKADAYCMDATNSTCDDAMQWVDDNKSKVDKYRKISSSSPTVVVTGDGQWAISWDKETLVNRSSKAPGVVLTYVGPGSLYRQQMVHFKDIRNGNLGTVKKDETKPDPAKVTPPPIPKTYEVTIADDGLWIDDRNFPMGKSYTNKIEFYIDGEYQGQMYLHKGMDPITTELTPGTHIFAYKVSVRSASGSRIRQDCLTKFQVSGVELFNPHIKFDTVDQFRGTAKCSLARR